MLNKDVQKSIEKFSMYLGQWEDWRRYVSCLKWGCATKTDYHIHLERPVKTQAKLGNLQNFNT